MEEYVSFKLEFLSLRQKYENSEFTIIIIIIIIIIRGWDKLVVSAHPRGIDANIQPLITEHEDITVLWNQGIQTDREVLANRPDIIIKTRIKPAY
jgi:hypothetical protein